MSASRYELRVLTPADPGLMRELNAVFGEAFNEPETYGAEPADDGYLTTLLAKPHIVVIVAIQDEAVVGGLVAYELEKFERKRSEFYIYDLAVEYRHRRRGVATACMESLREIAAERRAWGIFVQAALGDDAAVALYQRFGSREDVLHFDIPPRHVRELHGAELKGSELPDGVG